MSLASLWAQALQAPGQGFTLTFDRLGLETKGVITADEHQAIEKGE